MFKDFPEAMQLAVQYGATLHQPHLLSIATSLSITDQLERAQWTSIIQQLISQPQLC